MNSHPQGRHVTRLALLALGAVVAGGAIAEEELVTITITASRMGRAAVTTEEIGRSSITGAPKERLTLTWSVPFTDLNLSTHSGAVELEKRVNARAQAVCAELDRLFPLAPPGGPSCVRDAAAGGMVQAHKVIAAAESAQAPPASK